MTKIALVDIDETLVRNSDSAINEELIARLRDGGYDQVWLFTGRLVSEVHRHVMRMGQQPPPQGWQDQLTVNLVRRLEEAGIRVAGVSTPADHGRPCLESYETNTDKTAPHQPGEGWKSTGLLAYEEELLLNSRKDEAEKRNVGGIAQRHSDTGERITQQLAYDEDMEKAGQVKHLLSNVVWPVRERLDIDFFDDKPENLDAVASAVEAWQNESARHVPVALNRIQVSSSGERGNAVFSFTEHERKVMPGRDPRRAAAATASSSTYRSTGVSGNEIWTESEVAQSEVAAASNSQQQSENAVPQRQVIDRNAHVTTVVYNNLCSSEAFNGIKFHEVKRTHSHYKKTVLANLKRLLARYQEQGSDKAGVVDMAITRINAGAVNDIGVKIILERLQQDKTFAQTRIFGRLKNWYYGGVTSHLSFGPCGRDGATGVRVVTDLIRQFDSLKESTDESVRPGAAGNSPRRP